jgi:N-acetylglutamate synthase-like GNAT family acetyltransferase
VKKASAAGIIIRKAIIGDVGRIQALVNHYASKETMLGLSLSEIYD